MAAHLTSFLTAMRRMSFVYGMFALATTVAFVLAFFLVGAVRWLAATPEMLWRDGLIVVSGACAAVAVGFGLWRATFATWPILRQAAAAIGPAAILVILSKLSEQHPIFQIRGENVLSDVLDSISLAYIGLGLLAMFAIAMWKAIPSQSSLSIDLPHFHIDIKARKSEPKD